MDGAAQGLAFAFEGDRRRDAEKAETAARIAELEAENADLKGRIVDLDVELDEAWAAVDTAEEDR